MVAALAPPSPKALLSSMESLADPTRLRLLRLLERHELPVTTLVEALKLPQSSVSRHLKVLSDEGFVASRSQGTSRLYRMERQEKDSPARRLWLLARDQTEGWATARQDALRLERALLAGRPVAQAFFAGAAAGWDRMREEAYGRSLNQTAILGLLPSGWTVADLGCGTGALAVALAPHVKRVIGVDQSAAMLKAAGARTAGYANVELRRGSLEALPIEDEACDAALLVLALSYVQEPALVVGEMARILRPGGRAVLLDALRHDDEGFQRAMGQTTSGFEAKELAETMETAGLGGARCQPLPPEPGSRGPALLLATAERVGARPFPVS